MATWLSKNFQKGVLLGLNKEMRSLTLHLLFAHIDLLRYKHSGAFPWNVCRLVVAYACVSDFLFNIVQPKALVAL